jgi:hypothetical protein
MQEPYIAPQLELAGEADQVVLGMGRAGADLFGEYLDQGGGFLSDEDEDQTSGR